MYMMIDTPDTQVFMKAIMMLIVQGSWKITALSGH